MKADTTRVLFRTAVFGFLIVSAAFSQTTVDFGITSAGPTGNNLAGVYTDPYVGCVGCTSSSTGTSLQIFCDDFTDDVSPPEYWTAYATNLSAFTATSNVTSVYYSSAPSNPATTPTQYSGLPTNLIPGWGASQAAQTFSQTTDYIAVAILAAESITAGTGNPMEQNDLSFALWGVFDTGLLDQAQNHYGTLPAADLTAAQTDLESALLSASTYSSGASFTQETGVNATIYTGCTGCSVGQTGLAGTINTTSSRPQEFVVVTMPEPSTPAVLGFYVFGIALVGGFFLRRQSKARS